MKKILVAALLLIAAGSTALFAAGGAQDNSGKKRIAVIMRTQADTFAAWLANSIVAEAKGYSNIAVDVMDGQLDDNRIHSFLENAITNKYDMVIIQCNNAEAQRPFVQKVVDAKIPVILTNTRIPGMEDRTNSVDANPYDQGAVVARYALDKIPQNAKVVVLLGPSGNMHTIERRRAWQEEFFAKRPDVQILAENIANYAKDEAMKLMDDWVTTYGQIDAVIGMNDSMTAGGLESVKNNPRYSAIQAYGVDGTAEAGLLIQEGKFSATSFQNAYELGRVNMRLANKIFSGQITGVKGGVENTDIDCPLITKENVQILIDAHKAAGSL
jgi:inositol transport system substrate-binding protein